MVLRIYNQLVLDDKKTSKTIQKIREFNKEINNMGIDIYPNSF